MENIHEKGNQSKYLGSSHFSFRIIQFHNDIHALS